MGLRTIPLLALGLLPASQAVGSDPTTVATAPPVVVQTVPIAGSVDVDPALRELRITWSKEMLSGSWSFGLVTRELFPKATGQPAYLEDRRTCVLPVELEPEHTYSIWLNSPTLDQFRDKGQRAALPYLLVFQTGKAKPRGD